MITSLPTSLLIEKTDMSKLASRIFGQPKGQMKDTRGMSLEARGWDMEMGRWVISKEVDYSRQLNDFCRN